MTADLHHKSRTHLGRYLWATLLPIVLLSASLSVVFYEQIRLSRLTRREIEGVAAIHLLYQSLTDLQKIRGLTQMALWKTEDVGEDLARIRQQFLDRLHQPDWRQKVHFFHLENETRTLENRAAQLFRIDPANTPFIDLFGEYSRLISRILRLMQLTADRSQLILDPELDTYYLIDILVKQIPYLAEAIGRLRGMGSGFLAKGSITEQEAERLQSYHSVIAARMETIRDEQVILAKVAPNLTRELELLPPQLDDIIATLCQQCRVMEGKEPGTRMEPRDFFLLATQAIDQLAPPYREGIFLLKSRLRQRQNHHLWQGGVIFCGSAIAILLMLYFNRSFYIRNLRLQEQLSELSVTDQLTGLHNRRHLLAVFPRQLRHALRHREHLFLGFLDVDHFKRYNDIYGHTEGDQVLQQIATTMNSILRRAGDYCFRIGGEEFCILFTEENMEKAMELAERLRHALEQQRIPHEGNIPWGIVTISLGLVKVPDEPGCRLEELMSRADQALYTAKEKGRNRYETG
ncbi:diguanylate cyclase domain-containing protein [Thermodesulfobacteriota bacterium B35]